MSGWKPTISLIHPSIHPSIGVVQDGSSTHTPTTCSRWYSRLSTTHGYKPDSSIHLISLQNNLKPKRPLDVFCLTGSSITKFAAFLEYYGMPVGTQGQIYNTWPAIPWRHHHSTLHMHLCVDSVPSCKYTCQDFWNQLNHMYIGGRWPFGN